MVVLHRRLDLVIPGVLWVGLAVWPGPATWAADDPPPLEGPVVHPGDDRPVPPSLRGTGAAVHEAVQEPGSGASRVSVPREPPAPVAERPPATPPEPRAQWAAGYWAWDPARDHFAWVGGLWVVPPSNRVWVNGRWQRDARGWSRVPGFWSPRRERDVMLPAWRNGGPPAEHPLDVPGPAPSPESFYVPGHYAPEGPRMVWTPGFWARSQPGWDWVPAR